MATDRRIDLGPTGETLRTNVQRLREAQNLTFAELSRRLNAVGNPIPPLGLRRMEAGERRVHVDDLTALAHVLGTSPANLLMPDTPDGDDEVTATGIGTTTARNLWKWIRDGTHTTGRRISLALYGGPEWWMNEPEPGPEVVQKEFFQKLRAIGLNFPEITEQPGTDGDR